MNPIPWRARCGTCWLPLAPILLAACTSAMLDLRKIEQPVMLGHATTARSGPGSPVGTVCGTYSATVKRSTLHASAGNTTTTRNETTNDAQVAAFRLIGGDPRKAIQGLHLDVDALTVYGVFILSTTVQIAATGEVVELAARGGRQ